MSPNIDTPPSHKEIILFYYLILSYPNIDTHSHKLIIHSKRDTFFKLLSQKQVRKAQKTRQPGNASGEKYFVWAKKHSKKEQH